MAIFFSPYGTGVCLPLLKTNSFAWASGAQTIAQSLRAILLTEPGERIGHPNFGVGLRRYLFAPNNVTTRTLIRDDIVRAIETEEGRIDLQEVAITADNIEAERINIRIAYSIADSTEVQSLIFPFYLDKGAG